MILSLFATLKLKLEVVLLIFYHITRATIDYETGVIQCCLPIDVFSGWNCVQNAGGGEQAHRGQKGEGHATQWSSGVSHSI